MKVKHALCKLAGDVKINQKSAKDIVGRKTRYWDNIEAERDIREFSGGENKGKNKTDK